MRSTKFRQLLVGVTGIAAIAAPAALLHGGSKPVAAVTTAGGAQTQDEIQYLESSKATTVQYLPVGGRATSEAIQGGGGGCSSPTPVGVPILNFGAQLYTGTDTGGVENYTGAPSPASAGIYKARTGVCSIPQDWSIDNVTGSGAEGLDFSVGTNTLVAGRIFSEASIVLQRSDRLTSAVDVQLVESLNGSPVANQCYSIPDTNAVSEDTNNTNASLGDKECTSQNTPAGTGFDTLEVRVLTPGGSVSVVGPTSTFFLTNQICAGQQIQTSSSDPNLTGDSVNFTTVDNATGCKSYTDFSTTANNPGDKTANFSTFGAAGEDFKFTLDWGLVPECTPDGSSPGPVCNATTITVNGQNLPQSYCPAATSAQPVCTTSRDYSIVNVNGTNYTHITETYDTLIDITFHYG